jgi:hypothetical protein
MEYADLTRVIDLKNKDLWSDLQHSFKITVEYHDQPTAEVFSKNKEVQILVNKEIDSATFTHELLHLWIESKEIYIGSTLKLLIRENLKLSKVFSPMLLDHIGNTCEHFKMYPKYVSLGYNPSQFLYDNYIHKCTENEIKSLEQNYRVLLAIRIVAVDFFIGKFFAIHADHNIDLDYSNCKMRLEAVDGRLYKILSSFWNEWVDYDVEKEDGILVSYHQIAFDFYNDLEDWIRNKILI